MHLYHSFNFFTIFPSDNHYYEKFEDGTVNDITEEIPFEIPESWRWERFENIFNIINGFTPLKSNKVFWNSNDINWFTVDDYNEQGYEINYTRQFITNKALGKSTNRILPKDTVIICCTASIGTVAIANIPLTTNQQFNGLVKKEYFSDYFYSKFIYNYCLTLKNAMLDKAGKTTFPFLSVKKLGEFFIPFPPINEQKRIVNKIDSFEKYVSKYDLVNSKIELLNNNYKNELKKSILLYAIQGKLVKQDSSDEPAEVLINKILDEKRELIKTKQRKKENLSVIYKDSTDNQFYEKFDDGKIVNITEEIPFEIPDSWRWIRLENLVIKQIKRGKSPRYVDKSNVYVFAQKCNPKNGEITLENAKFLDEEILNKYDESDFINKNDIIINSTGNGTLGRIGIIDEERIFLNKIVVDSHVTLIRINKNYINPYYIFYLLKTYQRYLESQASGSTNQTELSPEVIKKLLIPLPCTNEQNGVISKINSLLNLI